MSVIPLVYRDWWDDFDRPLLSRLMDQNMAEESIGTKKVVARRSTSSGGSTIQIDDKDNFQVILDVQEFSPEEITVKTVGNNVIVEAKHEERQDEHGYVSRQYIRRYVLPPSHDVINITSSLSSDGVLTITAPKKTETPAGTERVIEIVKTGEPASKPIKVEKSTE